MTTVNVGADTGEQRPDLAVAVYCETTSLGRPPGSLSHRENTGSALGDVLAGIETEIDEDRRTFKALMGRRGVNPSPFKSALGAASEVVGRLKSNGRVLRRSPSSSVVELEGLAAGILTKRNLWRSLRPAAAIRPGLDPNELDTLIDRANSQLDRVLAVHEDAARNAFSVSEPSVAGPESAA